MAPPPLPSRCGATLRRPLLLLALALAVVARGCAAAAWSWSAYWESVAFHSGVGCAYFLFLRRGLNRELWALTSLFLLLLLLLQTSARSWTSRRSPCATT